MKDKRDKLIPEQLSGYTWELSGYAPKVPFSNSDSLTMREVRNAFQLTPEPPEMELNDYIREAVRNKNLAYFSFFLHRFEKRLNGVIYRFLTRNGIDRYDPARFLDYKLEVLQMLLFCLPRFDPEQETEFLKYAKTIFGTGCCSAVRWRKQAPLEVLRSTSVCGISGRYIPIPARAAQRSLRSLQKSRVQGGRRNG